MFTIKYPLCLPRKATAAKKNQVHYVSNFLWLKTFNIS